mmetsp:Transcript_24509/g.56482  ORF Transcript_24509/g.56482 Transcript_24509/m.56482 type:complete len:660 (-) Transcript_24509:153-2132(-)
MHVPPGGMKGQMPGGKGMVPPPPLPGGTKRPADDWGSPYEKHLRWAEPPGKGYGGPPDPWGKGGGDCMGPPDPWGKGAPEPWGKGGHSMCPPEPWGKGAPEPWGKGAPDPWGKGDGMWGKGPADCKGSPEPWGKGVVPEPWGKGFGNGMGPPDPWGKGPGMEFGCCGKGGGGKGDAWPGVPASGGGAGTPMVTATTIPTERIGDIIGPRGAIIQRIKLLSGANKVHVEEETAGQTLTPVQVAGTDEAITKVAELVEAVLNKQYEELGFVRETLPTPTPPLGRAVSSMIKQVSSQTGAWVQQSEEDGGCITIIGLPATVEQAKKIFSGEEGDLAGGGKDGSDATAMAGKAAFIKGCLKGSIMSGKLDAMKGKAAMMGLLGKGGKGLAAAAAVAAAAAEPTTSVSVEIPAQRVKDILGVKGMNVKAIKQQSKIQKIDLVDRSDPATVTLTGTQEACDMAKHMVLAIAAGDQSVIGNMVETIDIDQRLVSKLIGAKGAAINQIKDASGCYLEVRETGGGSAPRVIMTGPRDAVDRARDLVTRFLIEQTVAANQQAVVAAAGQSPQAAIPGLPGLGGDAYAALLTDANAQLQAQLLLQAQLAQLAQAGADPSAAAMAGLSPELALQLEQHMQQQGALQQMLLQQAGSVPQAPQVQAIEMPPPA